MRAYRGSSAQLPAAQGKAADSPLAVLLHRVWTPPPAPADGASIGLRCRDRYAVAQVVQGSKSKSGGRARRLVLVAIFVTAALYAIPYGYVVAYPLMLLSTFAHEMGHGCAALVIGGRFSSFHLYADGSGVAMTMVSDGRLARAWVAAGGLLGPAVVSSVAFIMSTSAVRARRGLVLGAMVMLLSLVFVVRNPFAFAFIGGLAACCLLFAWWAPRVVGQALLAFFAVQLALSVFSRADYLFTPVARTATGSSPSDVAQIAAALFLPYWFWGGVCALLSLMALASGFRLFWRATA